MRKAYWITSVFCTGRVAVECLQLTCKDDLHVFVVGLWRDSLLGVARPKVLTSGENRAR